MKARTRARMATVVVASAGLLLVIAGVAGATVTPPTGALSIAAGASGNENLTISVPAGTTPNVDIEFVVDTTGSMAGGIARAQADAIAIVTGVQAVIPGAQFAVVQFKDSTDAIEYRVEQSMTASASAVSAALNTLSATGGADNPEAQNTVFHNSATPVTGGSIGWRAGSRSFVIVLTDSEPHGAGSAGVAGCVDTSADPHGLNTATVLAEAKAALRTIFMVLEPGAQTSSLACYQGIAARGYAGGQGVNGGVNLAPQILALVTGATTTVTDLHLSVASATPVPAAASWITSTPPSFGPLATPFTVTAKVTATVPAATPAGTYVFDLVALADGADVGHHVLTITVGGGGADTTPPSCAKTSFTGMPDTIYITMQDGGSGMASIVVASTTNATVTIPAFTAGTTAPLVVKVSKVTFGAGQAKFVLTDVAGNVSRCDPYIKR